MIGLSEPKPRKKKRRPAPTSSYEKPKVKCERCGTYDCISSEEYRKHIKYNRGGVSVDPNILSRTCNFRRQLQLAGQVKMRTRSGKDVYLTKELKRVRPKAPPPPPKPRNVPDIDKVMENVEDTIAKSMENLDKRMEDLDDRLNALFNKTGSSGPK